MRINPDQGPRREKLSYYVGNRCGKTYENRWLSRGKSVRQAQKHLFTCDQYVF